jgi:hypothetical protein
MPRAGGLQLLAVNEKRIWPGQRIAVLIEITEERESAILEGGCAVIVGPLEAGDVVVNQLRG